MPHSVCILQTGTLTVEGLDFCVLIPVVNGQLDPPVHDPTQLRQSDPIIVAMATCHSLTVIGGQLSGDPLDISMFNAISWVRFLRFSSVLSAQLCRRLAWPPTSPFC